MLIDKAWGGYTARLGTIEITKDGVQTYRLPETAVITKAGLGRLVRIVLECDRVWRPSEVYGTADAREHTVQLYSFGTDFYGDTGATVREKPRN
ncbi:MAG TPA: hypothetical protein VNA69_17405 [Thermoanaerobaculia bacterium]|nr:hypothetical protein [Thermoanaerobaculia bacterium]